MIIRHWFTIRLDSSYELLFGLGGFTSVPILVKIDQEMLTRKSAHRWTDANRF